MEGFQFQKRPMITICGKEYECDPTNTDLIEGMMRDFPRIAVLSEKLQSLKEKMLTATENYNAKEVEKYTQQAFRLNKELLEACRDFIFNESRCAENMVSLYHRRTIAGPSTLFRPARGES